MGNEVQVQKTTGGLTFKVPADIAAQIKAAGGGNILDRDTTNRVNFSTKAFEMHVNGESKFLTRRPVILDDDGVPTGEYGEPENIQIMHVVVVDWNHRKERALYAPWAGTPKPPECSSPDGVRPYPTIEDPKAAQCNGCPMSLKGSRVNDDGKAVIACSQYRVLAILPEKDLDFPLLKIKFKHGSDWDTLDEPSASKNWYAWQQYTDFLRANDLKDTSAVFTQIRFAPNQKHAQLQFKPVIEKGTVKYLTKEEFDKVKARAKSEECVKLLAGFNPAPKPQGKPLPKDDTDGPQEQWAAAEQQKLRAEVQPPRVTAAMAETVAAAQKLRAAEEAEAARHAEAAAEAKEMAEAKAEKKRKVDEAKAALAALEAEEGGFDDGPKPPAAVLDSQAAQAAQAEVEKKRTRRSKAEMEAVRAAEAAAKATIAPPMETPVITAMDYNSGFDPGGPNRPLPEPVTTTSLGGPAEIPAALAAALPAWD